MSWLIDAILAILLIWLAYIVIRGIFEIADAIADLTDRPSK